MLIERAIRDACCRWCVEPTIEQDEETRAAKVSVSGKDDILIIAAHEDNLLSKEKLEAWLPKVAPFEPVYSMPVGDIYPKAINDALAKLDYREEPVIVASPELVGQARAVARETGLAFRIAEDLDSAFYVEWRGRRVGSRVEC